MALQITADPILTRLRAALNAAFGERIERVVLFGSRARGDARPDSDYDVALFLYDLADRWRVMINWARSKPTFCTTPGRRCKSCLTAMGTGGNARR